MRRVFLDGCVVLIWRTTRKVQRLWDCWDLIQSAWQLRGVDCGGLDMLNVWWRSSSDVQRWSLREPSRGDVQGKLGGNVSKGICSFGLSREDDQDRDYWRLRIKEATGWCRFTWKMAIKPGCVCAHVLYCIQVSVWLSLLLLPTVDWVPRWLKHCLICTTDLKLNNPRNTGTKDWMILKFSQRC